MKSRNNKLCAYSAFANYECSENLGGWDPVTADSQDIFKQLKNNLNKYQRKYNQSKQKTLKSVQPLSFKREIQDKQNAIKLPIIGSAPLKNVYSNKEPFAIKNRNILEDAMNYTQQTKENKDKCVRILKLVKIKKNSHLEMIVPANPNDLHLNLQKGPVLRHKKSNALISERRKSTTKRRHSKKLIDYDFSDSRLIIQSRKAYLEVYQAQLDKQNE